MTSNFFGGTHHHHYYGSRRGSAGSVSVGSTVWGLFFGVLALGFVVEYWPLLVGVVGFFLIAWLGLAWWGSLTVRRSRRVDEERRLVERLEAEHRAYLAGVESATFGRFPPAV